ncbi:MAG: hypothetical protein AAGI01_09330 [Myxococcota bacterium]
MEETKSSWPRTLTQGGKTFKGRVDNPVVFRAYMMVKMPTLGITGAYIEDIDVTTSKVALPYSWGVKNLFGRGSTAAAVAAAEAAAVSLLVLNVRNQGASLTAHVRSLAIKTVAEVDEEILFECEDGPSYAQFVADAAESGKETWELSVVGHTRGGTLTHRVDIIWELAAK